MKEDDSRNDRGRLWQGLRTLLFGEESEPTLRDQIEEAITGAGDGGDAVRNDLTTVERQMLRNLLRFGERTVGDVAVPRADIIAVPEVMPFAEVVDMFVDAGHSRLPVYRESLDDIVGMIHLRDMFGILAGGDDAPATVSGLIRQPLYVPGSMGVLDLLAEMRLKRVHLAIVIDEYSGTDGLVTIEDLVEEIVGEIEDEHDEAPTATLVALEDGIWEADARASLEEVAEQIDARLAATDSDVDTIGGLAFVLAGRVPQPGERVLDDSGWTIEVIQGDVRRASRVRLHPPAPAMEI